MRVTVQLVNKITTHLDTISKGEYRVPTGGSTTGHPGSKWTARAQTRTFDSALGENRSALAFFLGVLDHYKGVSGEWAETRDSLADTMSSFATWFERGQDEGRQNKRFAEAREKRAAEKDKAIQRHNRSQTTEGTTLAEPRRVKSSSQDLDSETGYDGTNWPTHSVELWIMNDSSFIDTARNYARFDETGEQLGKYISRLLVARHELVGEELKRITRDDLHTLTLVAGDLTRENDSTPAAEALKQVDWKWIARSLTDGE